MRHLTSRVSFGRRPISLQRMAANVDQSEALPDEIVERLLVLIRREAVACLERRPTALLEDCGVAILSSNRVAAHGNWSEALPDKIVERLLVLIRREAVACLERRPIALLEDCGVAILATSQISVDLDRSERLPYELIEDLLVLV